MKQHFGLLGRAAAASAVMFALAAPSQAGVIATYTDRTLWAGSLTAVQTVDFNETMASGGDTFQNYSNSTGYTDPSSILNFLGRYNTTYELYRTTLASDRLLRGPSFLGSPQDTRLEINVLAAAARGFGIYISSTIPGVTYEFTVNGSAVTTVDPIIAGTTPVFFGFTTDTDISQVVIRAVGPPNDTQSFFDNAEIGQAGIVDPPPDPDPSGVPEPSTYLTMATGILALAWTRYRRSVAQQG